MSDAETVRPELDAPVASVRDVLVVWRLDRLGRSLPRLLDLVGQLELSGVDFWSLTKALDAITKGVPLGLYIFPA